MIVMKEEGFCEIKGRRNDWQVLWSDSTSNVCLIGMTPKMKEQLEWCGEYLTEFQSRGPFQSPLFKLDVVKRVSLDNVLLYTMIRRRLLNDPHPDYMYYTLMVPKFLPSDSQGEIVMHLWASVSGEGRRKPKRLRMDVYLDFTSQLKQTVKEGQ